MPPQRQKHISQIVGIVTTLPAAPGAAFALRIRGSHCVATVVAPIVAAEICRNRRRESCCMT